MRPRVGKWVIVIALVLSTGGQWFALQSMAWLTMAVRFSQTDTLLVSLQKTFDGRHPCRLCKAVQEGRKAEQKPTTLKVDTKLDLWFTRMPAVLPVAPPATHCTTFVSSPCQPRGAPPSPPPRLG